MPSKKRGLDSEAMKYGARLEAARLAMDLTQEEMGKRLGLTVSTYRSYEKGRSRIPLEVIPRLADVTGRTVYYFHGMPEPRGLDGDEQMLVSLFRRMRQSAKQMIFTLAKSLVRDPEAVLQESV